MRGSAPGSCRDAALRLLGRRDHTRAELRDKLRRRGYPAEEVDATLEELKGRALLDDAATARSLARASASRGKGHLATAADLSRRGVSREDARQALDALDPEDEAAALRRALARKAATLPARLTPQERSKKLLDHLVRRGFSVGAVLEALRQKGAPVHDEED